MKYLKQKLRAGDKDARPVWHINETVEVKFGIALLGFDSMEPLIQSPDYELTVSCWLRFVSVFYLGSL